MTNIDSEIRDQLNRIEAAVQSLLQDHAPKEWYSTSEVAAVLRKADYTVREWCRLGRVRATKKPYARGAHTEWLIGHEELTRIRNEGLLPIQLRGGAS